MLTNAPFPIRGRRTLLLANGWFSADEAKTAACFLRYRGSQVVAVLDKVNAGKTADDVLGYGGKVPVVGTIDDALAHDPEQAIIGIAPMGGELDEALRLEIAACLIQGVDVVSGLHMMLASDPELVGLSEANGAQIWDVRRPPAEHMVSRGGGCITGATTVLVVGSDCNVGKMTVTLELNSEALKQGMLSSWAATGQTGILLRERGIAVDAVVSDFVGGATEALVNLEGLDVDLVFVEGQGSIVHPSYAAVSIGIMYGCMPDCMILAHTAGRKLHKHLQVPIPPLRSLVRLYDGLMRPHKNSRVVGVALNTSTLSDVDARAAISEAREETGLPVTDVVRFGSTELLECIQKEVGSPQ